MAFRVAAAQCKRIGPERLNWPGRLAGIAEFQNKNSRPLFTIILKPEIDVSRIQIFNPLILVVGGVS